MYGSLYGLQRGDTDFGSRAETKLLQIPGCLKIEDFGEGSLFLVARPADDKAKIIGRETASDHTDAEAILHKDLPAFRSEELPTMVVLYGDDYNVSGADEHAVQVHRYIADVVGIEAEKETYHYKEMIGLQRVELLPNPDTGARRLVIHQVEYILYILEDFERRFNGGKRLKGVDTPMWVREERKGTEEAGGAEGAEFEPACSRT